MTAGRVSVPVESPYIAGASAEQPQQASAWASFRAGMLAGRVGQRLNNEPTHIERGYVTSPQVIPTRPDIATQVSQATVGVDTGGGHLPGRLPGPNWNE